MNRRERWLSSVSFIMMPVHFWLVCFWAIFVSFLSFYFIGCIGAFVCYAFYLFVFASLSVRFHNDHFRLFRINISACARARLHQYNFWVVFVCVREPLPSFDPFYIFNNLHKWIKCHENIFVSDLGNSFCIILFDRIFG